MKKENDSVRFPTRTSMVMFFLRGSKRFFIPAIICACMVSLLDLINPKIIGYTVDSVIDQQPSSLPHILQRAADAAGGAEWMRMHLYAVALLVAGIALLAALFRYLFQVLNTMGAEKLVQTMRDQLFSHILRLPFAWHSQNHTGDIIQRCTSDVDTIKVFLSEQLTSLFRTFILIGLALYFMYGIHPLLATASAVFIPIIIGYSFFFHRRIGDEFEKVDVEEGKLSSIVQENLTGVRVVKAFGREINEREKFEKQNEYYTGFWVRLMKSLSLFWSSGDMVSYLQVLVILCLGSWLGVNGQLSAGDFIAFLSYNALLNWPVRALGRVISNLSKAGISIDRISYIMNAEEEHDKPVTASCDMHQDIAFDHVSFQYENGSGEVLKDISFTIPAGSTFGILGGTGSGKSTLMYLLDRLYDIPDGDGRILIGGTDISDLKEEDLRRSIGMVLQEPYLFSRTLSENIAIAQDHADMKQIRQAARIASLDETIEKFTAGYDTYVGERGVTLSGGQKQRTAIAQMLIRKPPIMVFDDSLSAVDAETDSKIRHALKENTSGSTVILIAHRITTLMNADQIAVLDHGRLKEIGSHEQLLEKNGIYRRIYDLQMQGMEDE